MKVGIIGFGEVGAIFARDLAAGGAEVLGFDILPGARERAAAAGVGAARVHDATAGADVVFVCVTAGSVLDAVRSLEGTLASRPFVVDVNSVAPSTKQAAARIVEAAGGRYVEAAVMASVPPKGLRSPILLGGPHCGAFTAAMAPFGMDLTAFSPEVGRASSVKMCRSVMVKGMEALVTECLLTARHYGVEMDVLRSLGDTLPHENWAGLARYMVSRSLIHGKRRAEEMVEVAKTVGDAGVEPSMSRAIVERQDWAWRQGVVMGRTRDAPELVPLLDALAAAMEGVRAAE